MTRLSGKVAIVTGGGTGIGRATALSMAKEGAKVAILGRRKDKLNEVYTEILNAQGHSLAIACDISKDDQIKSAVDQAEKAFGKINVLVNNAGTLSATTIENITEEEWDRVMATNLTGPFLMSRAVLPAMRRAGSGSIVNIGSILGLVAMKDRAAYCASKGGVTMLTKAMAVDHAIDNIRVNCICPSIVETDLVRDLFSKTQQGRDARDARLASIPAGRFGVPQDVADLVVFLASDESSWMTGTALPLDGGLTAY